MDVHEVNFTSAFLKECNFLNLIYVLSFMNQSVNFEFRLELRFDVSFNFFRFTFEIF